MLRLRRAGRNADRPGRRRFARGHPALGRRSDRRGQAARPRHGRIGLHRAAVEIVPVSPGEDEKNVREMLTKYIDVLSQHEQKEEADAMRRLLRDWQSSFVKAVPKRK